MIILHDKKLKILDFAVQNCTELIYPKCFLCTPYSIASLASTNFYQALLLKKIPFIENSFAYFPFYHLGSAYSSLRLVSRISISARVIIVGNVT
jgi:hypothetical protein